MKKGIWLVWILVAAAGLLIAGVDPRVVVSGLTGMLVIIVSITTRSRPWAD
jgi:hypothetical protein